MDVQPKLGARVRLLSTGTSNKNDPNDARSVAVAALRSPVCQQVRADDHALILRVWSRRHRQLSRLRSQAACRLHAVLCEIIPGGVGKDITVARAAAILGAHHPADAMAAAWHDLAGEHLTDLRRLDAQLRDTRNKLTAAVRASGTSLTEVFGVGPVVAATVIGDVTDITRFPTADKFASCNGTAPNEVSSGQRKILPAVHARQPTPQPRHPHGRSDPDRAQAQRRTRLLPAQTRRRKDASPSPPGAEAQDQQRHLRPPPSRHQNTGSGPGRATGERHEIQRGRLTPRTPALRTSHSRTRHHATPAREPQVQENTADIITCHLMP